MSLPVDRRGRGLDFIVIGAQKGGTTSLWEYLRRHPSIRMPALKEAPFFTSEAATRADGLSAFIGEQYGDAPQGVLLGKATPWYMMGLETVDVPEVARRMAAALPDVKLIALLRDPIERAVSHYRMSARRGIERRSFDVAASELLEAGQLAEGRRHPTETNSYVVQGEYGRILSAYRACFPLERIHTEQACDLASDPAAVLDRILTFLELPPGYRPPNLDVHYHRSGGRRRLDPESEAWLFRFLDDEVWPRLRPDAKSAKLMFHQFYEVWSVLPDDDIPPLSASTRGRLEAHYRSDASVLADMGIEADWVAKWAAARQAPSR